MRYLPQVSPSRRVAELGLGPGFVCSEVCAVKIELRLHGEAGMTPLVVIVLEPEKGCDREISCLRPWPRLLDEENCIGWRRWQGHSSSKAYGFNGIWKQKGAQNAT